MTAGYSGTPLAKKLGVKAGYRVAVVNMPSHYMDLLGVLPDGIEFVDLAEGQLDFIHLFAEDRAFLEAQFPILKTALAFDGALWVSWYKKAAKIPTDVDENIARDIGLGNGLVDVKVAAIDAQWSGLKFVYRVKDRA
jgi:hypothetical protein